MMTTNSKDAALQRIKQFRIDSTQGYSGLLTRESQVVFNYVTAQADAEISLTMPPRAESYQPISCRAFCDKIYPKVICSIGYKKGSARP